MRHTLETIIRYCVEQGLIEAPLPLEKLFFTGLGD